MSIILSILVIAVLAFVLNVVIIQSNNIIFMILKKPMLWVFFMGFLSFVFFLIGSRFEDSFTVVFWAALLAVVERLPPKAKRGDSMSQREKNKLVDEMYNEMGITNGRLKYRIGLAAYVVCGVLGWLVCFSEEIG